MNLTVPIIVLSVTQTRYILNPSFPFPYYCIWKGPLPHKYTPVWVTCVRESLGGVTGVGGDPNQVPSVGEFYLAFGMIFHGFMSWAYCLSIYFVILFSLFSLFFLCVLYQFIYVLVLFYCFSHFNLICYVKFHRGKDP